jgi:hypothetical protein
MKTLAELINEDDPAWPLVQSWLAVAPHSVQILPVDRALGEQTLLALQVTTHSTLGAVALETGGILLDHGWLRILGGSGGHGGSLREWNGLAGAPPRLPGALLVAHDAVGGFFALNNTRLSGPPGSVHYRAPDSLAWEGLDLGYSDFLHWAATGDLARFYATLRWPGWEVETDSLPPDRGFSFYPPLWAVSESPPDRSRRAVPMLELWDLQQEMAAQLRLPPESDITT